MGVVIIQKFVHFGCCVCYGLGVGVYGVLGFFVYCGLGCTQPLWVTLLAVVLLISGFVMLLSLLAV